MAISLRQLSLVLIALSACGSPSDDSPSDASQSDSALSTDSGVSGDSGSSIDSSLPDGAASSREVAPAIYSFAGSGALAPDELAPLMTLVGNARYIGLGESVHTSGGYYELKRKLIQYLVEQANVRVFAMETPRSAAQQVEDYLQSSCQGSARTALTRAIFGVFADDNTEALMSWLCQYNQAHRTDPVHFFGFDAQQPEFDGPELQTFFDGVAPQQAATLMGGLATCRKNDGSDFVNGLPRPFPASEYDPCIQGLDAIDGYLAANRPGLVTATSEERVSLAEIASLSYRSWQPELRYLASNAGLSYEVRDVAMHQIFQRLIDLRHAGKRVVIWAHNYHLLANHPTVRDDMLGFVRTFGTDLARRVGTDYAAVALIGRDVSINWPGVGNGPVESPTYDSIEMKLNLLAEPYLIVDPRSSWLGPPNQTFPLGGPGGGTMVPAAQFRALLYLQESYGMRALFW